MAEEKEIVKKSSKKYFMIKNVLNLSSKDAKKFFLDQEAYSNIELPPYFIFNKMLTKIDKEFNNKELTFGDLGKAKKYETVNHVLYGNKDGKYAWRKYEIINPLLYISLVNVITEHNNWNFLQGRFRQFQLNKNIECESIPVLQKFKSKQRASQISQWVSGIENRSIALYLEYKFLYQTDITDCYGSLYTHSIPWAIHTKEESKRKREYIDLFGNKIDHHIQAMSYGQTNGIPQGSILMDFVVEIVLGYIDTKLWEKLAVTLKGKKFHILRYRDDYRIFTNDVTDGDIILKCLSETLLDFGFRLNANKTYHCDDIITGSIKPDKIDALRIEAVPKNLTKAELLRQLLIVQQIGKKFPNAGALKNRLSKVLEVVKNKDFYNQQEVISSLLIDIAYNNPNSFPVIAGLISNCISKLPSKSKKELIIKIKDKICTLANIGLIEIWIQRMSIGWKFKLQLNEKLCQAVYGKGQAIFVTDWINYNTIKKLIDSNSYIDKSTLSKTKALINKKEVQIFDLYNN